MKKADANNPSLKEAMEIKNADRSLKTHLTQMQTLNNDLNPPPQMASKPDSQSVTLDAKTGLHGRFTTVTDAYFNRNRFDRKQNPMEVEQLKNHYKFHKGTTYTIGKMGDNSQESASLAKESFN